MNFTLVFDYQLKFTHPPVSAVIHFTKQKLKDLNTRSYRTKIIYQYQYTQSCMVQI